MKCPYPDCSGTVTPGEQFCGTCGRSLAPEAIAAALGPQPPGSAGPWPATAPGEQPTMPLSPGGPPPYGPVGPQGPGAMPPGDQAALGPTAPPGLGAYGAPPPGLGAYGAPPPADPPAYGPPAPLPGVPPPPVSPPGLGAYGAPPAGPPAYGAPPAGPPAYGPTAPLPGAPPMAPAARRGFNPLWLLVGGIGAVILVCLACAVLFVVLPSSSSTPTPTTFVQEAPTPTTQLAAAPTATTGGGLALGNNTPVVGELPTPTETGQILYTHTEFDNYTDDAGTLVVFGTVHNISDGPLENIKVTAELRDSADKTLASGDDTFLALTVVQQDQTVPFQVRIPGVNDTGDKIHITVESEPYDPAGSLVFTPAQNLSFADDTLSGDAGSQTVSGRIHNGGTTGVSLAKALVIGYDAGGAVVDVAEGFTQTNPVPAGGDGTFIAQFSRADTTIAKYDITVFASEQP